jgi:hypothetical protein
MSASAGGAAYRAACHDGVVARDFTSAGATSPYLRPVVARSTAQSSDAALAAAEDDWAARDAGAELMYHCELRNIATRLEERNGSLIICAFEEGGTEAMVAKSGTPIPQPAHPRVKFEWRRPEAEIVPEGYRAGILLDDSATENAPTTNGAAGYASMCPPPICATPTLGGPLANDSAAAAHAAVASSDGAAGAAAAAALPHGKPAAATAAAGAAATRTPAIKTP